MLTIIYFSGEYLALVVAITTAIVMILMIIVYPKCIAPMFNDLDELKEEEYDGIRQKILDMSENIGYPMSRVYI